MNKNLWMKMGPLFTIFEKNILSVPVKLKSLTNLPGIAKIVQTITRATGSGIFAPPLPTKVDTPRWGAEIQVPKPIRKCAMSWTKDCAAFLALCRNSVSWRTLKRSSWNSNWRFSFRTEPISGHDVLCFTISVDTHLPPNQLQRKHQNQAFFSLNYQNNRWV